MKTSAPLSKVQYGLYVECVSHQGEAFYNLPYLYELDGSLDGERLRRAVIAALKSHPTIFTRIVLDDGGEPLQTIDLDNEDFSLEIEEIKDIEHEKQHFIQPFDIYGGRLFRVALMHDSDHYFFIIDIHHIIADGTSLSVLLHDIERAYTGEDIPAETISMAQIALDEAEARKLPAFDDAKRWYAANFDCGDTFTQFLPDRYESEHSEASQLRTLGIDMSRVDKFCKDNGIFKSNFFTSAFSFLLAKYNNEQESLFTTIYNGRGDKRTLRTMGMTVKTLPVYGKFTSETTVLDFMRLLQDQMSGCRKHDIYSFSDVMTDLNLQSNAMFAWHGTLFGDESWAGLPMKTVRLCNSTLEASFYLKVYILGDHYYAKAEYNSNEYSQEIIAQLLESYEAVVEGMLSQKKLSDIDIATSAQVSLLDSFNENDVDYDDTQTIVSLFGRQAAATPSNTAVVYNGRSYTYAQVDDMSNRIAAAIAASGLGRKTW